MFLAHAGRAVTPMSVGHPKAAPGSELDLQHYSNWSGFDSDDATRSFTGASTEWTIPSPVASAPDHVDVTIWPGNGAGDSTVHKLIQAGTDTRHESGSDYEIYAWTEIVPGEHEVKISGFPASPGDEMRADVAWDPAAGKASFFLVNYSAGQM